ncbi:DUF2878 domain-containing protein [Variovorax sp. RHLX14]|uniref:DUF2878 domain-containing protein n=1 Tax=Variovorax sp. RHLX14 TaxID=1259731 RepID=UPI003F45DC13
MSVVRPSRRVQIANFALSQLGWFAAVLGAAHGMPLPGTVLVLAVIGWHLAVSARPSTEIRLVVLVGLVGFAAESINTLLGNVAYPSGQPFASLAPYWIVALWALLAIALNVTLRWLRDRTWLAAGLGAVLGPVSFSSGVRLGGAEFVHPAAALVTLACVWAVLLPAIVRLSIHFDGVAVPEPIDVQPHANA